MNVRKRNCDGQSVLLFLFSKESCFHKRQILYPEETIKVEIEGEALDFTMPLEFSLQRSEEGFFIDEKFVGDGGYHFLRNRNNEPVLLVPVPEKDTLDSCRKMNFVKEVIEVGKDFGKDIFYEYASFGSENIFSLYRERSRCKLEVLLGREDSGMAEVYINGKAVRNTLFLVPGDMITFMGLSILMLRDMILCTTFFGRMRMTETEMLPMMEERPIRVLRKQSVRSMRVEELTYDWRALHQEKFELMIPEPARKEHVQPLFLSIGPSATMMLPVLLMAALGSVSGQSSYYLITVAMTTASAALSVFWGLVNHFYRKHEAEKEEEQRVINYAAYLHGVKEYLEVCMEENREILCKRYPHYSSFLSEDTSVVKVSYGRRADAGDTEQIRLGCGDIPFQMEVTLPKKRLEPVSDELIKRAGEISEAYAKIKNVPVGISLKQMGRIGFAGADVYSLLLQFLLQVAANYDGRSLRIIYLYHDGYREEEQIAECLRWLPHVWTQDKDTRLLAGNGHDAGEVISAVTAILRKRKEEGQQNHFLFLISNDRLAEGEGLLEHLRMQGEEGITICYVNRKKEQLPGDCECFVLQEEKEIRYLKKETVIRQPVEWEYCRYREAQRYMRSMAGLPVLSGSRGGIPSQVSFLDLYDCDKVEDLGCQSRWRENRTGERMRVPIGYGEGGKKICLDIHEKFHGPHGLVAGTTGAGKSELLQTYLLSLSVSFCPEDVSFFIIDYKGGGMGDVLADLPHCSGIISNLSGRQIKRALLSIKSENLRRQSLLSRNKVSHIEEYKELYQAGEVSEPMPHLLLVVDEFAELKKEEPEFMQEIISVSQVGRSLGVHLILATQKPAGCVDDKIWSNTRFRLCLRVADKQDSTDMLHRPEAAFLTGAGKGYLQVGNDELFLLFQAGYCKAPYQPGTKSQRATALVSVTGRRLSLKREASKKQKKQLECVREYLKATARDGGYQNARELWMPELLEQLTLKDVAECDKGVCIGLCDDPGRQRQYPVFYRPERDGHLCLCGGPATGKSTFLQTLLWQLCMQHSPEEVRFLLAASDAAGVNCFEEMPHCLGSMKESRDGECFFYHLERFLEQRKALLEGIGFAQYQKRQSKKIPILFVIIDNYGSFRRMSGDAYEELIEKIAGEGLNYGIYLVMTALGAGGGEIPSKLFEKIKTTIALELSDRVMYGDVLRRYRIGILPKEGCKGRGLIKSEEEIMEMQVPVFSEEDDYGRIEAVKEKALSLRKKQMNMPHRFPYIPYKENYQNLLERFMKEETKKDKIPLGYVKESGFMEWLHLQKGQPFVITGGHGSGKKSLLSALMYGCICQGMQVVLFDKRKEFDLKEKTVTVIDGLPEWNKLRKELSEKKEGSPVVLAVGNLADFANTIPYEENMPPMLIISGTNEELTLIGNPWYEWLLTVQCGICLGGNAGSQRILSFEDLGYEHMSRSKPPGYGYLKQGVGKPTRFLYLPVLPSKETEDNGKEENETKKERQEKE